MAHGDDLARTIGFAFLTPQTFVLLESSGMRVYCIPTSPTSFSELEHVWLGLPKLHGNAEFRSLTLHTSDGDPGTRSEITLRDRMCVILGTIANIYTQETRDLWMNMARRRVDLSAFEKKVQDDHICQYLVQGSS